MKFKEFKHEPVQPDTYEASMALNQLMRIGKHAIKLHNMIDDAAEMESWVAKKIDLAGDYVKKVYNYTEGEKAGLYDDGGMTEDAPFGSGMDLVRMAVLRKFISAEEYMAYAKELKAAGEEVEQNYDDWPEGEGFGSSDGNFAIKDLMTTAGYEFDEQDKGGRFIVTKMPEKLEKMGIKNVRMRDAVTTDSLEARLEAKLSEDANNLETAYKQIAMLANNVKKEPTDADDQMDVADDVARPITKILSTIMDYNKGEQMPDGSASKTTYVDMYKKLGMLANKGAQTNDPKVAPLLFKMMSSIYDMDKVSEGSIQEDAGEGHMSKSTLYHTAKYAIALLQMIKKGDDLEGWVQSKLNKAADYLQGVYNYEEYQKLNPYREELDSNILQKHAQVVQKNIDEILARETKLDDIDTKPGMMRILAKRVNEVEKEIAKENRKQSETQTDESGILYRAGVKKYGKAGMKAIQSAAGKGANHQEIGKIKDKHLKDDEQIEEGLKDWAKKTAMAGVIIAGLAGVGSIQDAIDRSVPAVQAMETALELAQDQNNDELAKMIKNDLSAVKVRLSSGKDLNFVKDMQDKYSKFIQTEGLAYESKLQVQLNQQLK